MNDNNNITKPRSPELHKLLPLIIASSLAIGIILGINFSPTFTQTNKKSDNANKLQFVVDYITQNYVDDIDKNEFIEKAIGLIANNLDPHTMYVPAKTAAHMNDDLNSGFYGIGIEFTLYEDTIIVLRVLKNGPAANTRLRAGDRIIKVDSITIAGVGMSSDSIVNLIKGPQHTKVTIVLARPGSNKTISESISRDHIDINSVDAHYLINDSTGYIRFNCFATTSYGEFVKSMKDMNFVSDFNDTSSNPKQQSLIIDLRDNGGGYMDAATYITNDFLSWNDLIVYTRGRSGEENRIFANIKHRLSGREERFENLNIAILINEMSASASEIMAGAVQDNDRGIIIGRRSFGKGLVQEDFDFEDGSILRMTTMRYYTPSGRCIQRPYNNGSETYYEEAFRRYYNMDTTPNDSLDHNDTAKYFTKGGRRVYGGGGINPDITMPVDTTYYSKMLSDILHKTLIYKFALHFWDTHRNEMTKLKTTDEVVQFIDNQHVMDKFWDFVTANDVKISYQDKKTSAEMISRQLHSYIIRWVLDDTAFFKYRNENDPYIDTALNHLRINNLDIKNKNDNDRKD